MMEHFPGSRCEGEKKMVWQKRVVLSGLLAMVFLVSTQEPLQAQCAMCRTALLGSAEGRYLAQGFNRGILFLAGVPFLAIGIVSLLVFRSARCRDERESAAHLKKKSG